LSTRERIRMIRLMEQLEKHPGYALLLGIEVTVAAKEQKTEADQKVHTLFEY